MRVAVAETNDQANRDLIVFLVVKETTAVGFTIERPAAAVHDQPDLVFVWRDLP